jgi:dienelactone hydrolase
VTSTVAATAEAMKALGKPFEQHTYPGAGHGFLRQQSGRGGANLKAAREAWSATVAFLKKEVGR